MIFADGAVMVDDLLAVIGTKATPVVADLGAKWSAGTRTPGLNQSPTAVRLDNAITQLREDASSTQKLADLRLTDDGVGTNTWSLSGQDARWFVITNDALYFKAGTRLDYENQKDYTVTIGVVDSTVPGSTVVTTVYNLAIQNVDEVAPSFTSAATASVMENISGGSLVYQALTTDTDHGGKANVTYRLKAGGDQAKFHIDSISGAVHINASPDYETQKEYTFTVVATDGGNNTTEQTVTLTIENKNEAPSATPNAVALKLSHGITANVDLRSHFKDPDEGDTLTYSLRDASGNVITSVNGLSLTEGLLVGSPTKPQVPTTFRIRATDAMGLNVEKDISIEVVSKPVISSSDPYINAAESSVSLMISHAFTSNGVLKIQRADGSDVSFKLDPASSAIPSHKLASATTQLTITVDKSALLASAPVVDGDYGLKAIFSPAVGSPVESDPFFVKVDTVAPSAALTLTLVSDTGVSGSDGITANGEIQVGALGADATSWAYSTDSGVKWETGVGSTFTLGQATYAAGSVQVRPLDLAGNAGGVSKLGAIVVDSTPPTPGSPTILTLVNMPENAPVGTVIYTASASDANGVKFSLKNPDGLFTINSSSGQVALGFVPNYENIRQYKFTVVASDNAGNVLEKEITLNVVNVNEAPVATPNTVNLNLAQGVTANEDLRGNFSDPDAGDQLSYSLWDVSGNSITNINGLSLIGGALVGNPTSPQAPTTFKVRASDPLGEFVEKDISIEVVGKPVLSSSDIYINAADKSVSLTVTHAFTTNGVLIIQRADGTNVHFTVGSAGTGVLSHTVASPISSLIITVDKNALLASGMVVDGDYGLKAVFTPVSGVATVSDVLVVKVDTVAPSAVLTASLASDTGESGTDGITSNGMVNVGALAADASGWAYSTDGGSSWVTGSASAFTLSAGSYAADAVQVRQFDAAGNSGVVTKLTSIEVDTTAPSVLTASLASDTGESGTDGITSNGMVNVGALAAGASGWAYSTDGGTSWVTGSASAFTLAEGSYADNAVQVRQFDAAGNSGDVTMLKGIVVDATAPSAMLTASLASDTGTSSTDGITSIGMVNVGALAAGASGWAYSTDGGTSWVTGSASAFTLAEGSYADKAVQVLQFDRAGNSGVVTMLTGMAVDTTAPSVLTASLASDTGESGTDGITSNGMVNVGALAADASGWAYSTDGGSRWFTGSASAFTLAEGSYADNAVQVIQFDSAENSSVVTMLKGIVVDATAPSAVLTASLASDTGESGTDGITSNGMVHVGALAAGASGWAYSTDGGSSWVTGSASAFTLRAGSYAADVVQVRTQSTRGDLLQGHAAGGSWLQWRRHNGTCGHATAGFSGGEAPAQNGLDAHDAKGKARPALHQPRQAHHGRCGATAMDGPELDFGTG